MCVSVFLTVIYVLLEPFNLLLISLYSAFEHRIMDMWRFRNEYNNHKKSTSSVKHKNSSHLNIYSFLYWLTGWRI